MSADNNIDSLDIRVSSTTTKAVNALEKLQKKLGGVGKALESIDMTNLSKLAQLSSNCSNSLGDIGKVASLSRKEISKLANQKLKINVSDAMAEIERLQKEFSDVGKNYEFTGDMTSLEKGISSAEKKLDVLFEKEKKAIAVGGSFETQGFRSLQYDIAKTTNILDILRGKLADFQMQKEIDLSNLQISRGIDSDEAIDIDESQISDVAWKSMLYNAEAMKMVFGDIGSSISNWSDAVAAFGNKAFSVLNTASVSAKELSETLLDSTKSIGSLQTASSGIENIRTDFSDLRKLNERMRETSKSAEALDNNIKRFSILRIGTIGIEQLLTLFKSLRKEANQAGKTVKKFSRINVNPTRKQILGIKKSFAGLADAVSKTTGNLFEMSRKITEVQKTANKSKKLGLGKMLGTSLLFSTVFSTLSALKTAISEGSNNLVLYSGEYNNSISKMYSSLMTLRNAFSSAFAPVMNVVAPIIANFINLLAMATNKVGQLFAALTGKKFTVQAQKLNVNYADTLNNTAGSAENASDSIDKTAGSVSKLKKALTVMNFDQLNQLADVSNNIGDSGNSAGGGSVELTPGEMFEDTAIDEDVLIFAEKIKSALTRIYEASENTRLSVSKLWNEGLSKFKDFTFETLKDFYNSFLVPVGNWMLSDNSGLPKFFDITNRLLNEVDWWKLSSSLDGLYRSLQRPAQFVWGNLMAFYDKFLRPVATWTLGEGLPKLAGIIATFNNSVDWQSLTESLEGFYESIAPFAVSVGEGLINFFGKLAEHGSDFLSQTVPNALGKVSEALSDLKPETIKKIAGALGGVLGALLAMRGASTVADIIGADSPLGKALSALTKHPYLLTAIGIVGLVGALDKFGVIDVDWDSLVSRLSQVKEILSEFVSKIDWKSLTTSLGNLWTAFTPFAEGFADAFINALDILVNKIGAPLINSVAIALETFSSKLADMDPEGLKKIGAGFLYVSLGIKAIKISNTLLENLGSLGTKLKTLKDVLTGKAIADTVTKTGTAAAGAGKGFSALGTGILGSTAQLGAWIIETVQISHWLASLTEILQGGNGELSNMGGALKDLTGIMQNSKMITDEQKTAFDNLVESMENDNLKAEEMATTFITELGKAGISAEQFIGMISDASYQTTKTAGDLEILAEKASLLGEGFSESASLIDLSSVTTRDAFDGLWQVLHKLSQENLDVNSNMMNLEYILDQYSKATVPDAQTAFDALIQEFIDAGLPVEDFIKLMGEKFPDAIVTTNDTVSEEAKEMDENLTNHMTHASSVASSSAKEIVDNVTSDMKKTGEVVGDTFKDVANTSDSDWTASQASVEDALKLMQSASSEKMRAIYKNVESYTNSIYNITTNNWSALSLRVSQLMDEMNGSISEKLETTKSLFSNFGSDIAGSLNLFWAGRNAIQSFVDGFRSMYVPTPHFRISNWRQHNLPNGGMMQSPVFEVNWYKDGGIFGNASVIGVGEAGREAVLPLENRRSMRMIADSIVSSAGSGFMDESTMINAVAAGVSMAMSGMSFGDTPQNDVVIMIDGREVARAVNKANERMSYRRTP